MIAPTTEKAAALSGRAPAHIDLTKSLAVPHHANQSAGKTKIAIKNVDFYYGHSQALKCVSLDIQERRVTALIGPSGCGKSTLLRVLNRMYDLYPKQHAKGEVIMDGHNLLARHIDVMRLRARIGMVFQTPTPFRLSIYDNVAFGIRLHEVLSRAEVAAYVEEYLTRADLWHEVKDRLGASALGLSGGQQQRLCIARMIAMRPEVVLLDEPTSALDPISTARIEDLIDELKRELTVVIVTHNLQQAARCADQVAFMYFGELIEVGSAEEIFTMPRSKHTEAYVAGRFGCSPPSGVRRLFSSVRPITFHRYAVFGAGLRNVVTQCILRTARLSSSCWLSSASPFQWGLSSG